MILALFASFLLDANIYTSKMLVNDWSVWSDTMKSPYLSVNNCLCTIERGAVYLDLCLNWFKKKTGGGGTVLWGSLGNLFFLPQLRNKKKSLQLKMKQLLLVSAWLVTAYNSKRTYRNDVLYVETYKYCFLLICLLSLLWNLFKASSSHQYLK